MFNEGMGGAPLLNIVFKGPPGERRGRVARVANASRMFPLEDREGKRGAECIVFMSGIDFLERSALAVYGLELLGCWANALEGEVAEVGER